jgi:hypothetical protein
MQKTIIGRVSSDEIPYTYISPLESMVIFPEATY